MLVVTGKGHELVKQYYKKAPAASGPSSDGGRIGGVSGNDPIVID